MGIGPINSNNGASGASSGSNVIGGLFQWIKSLSPDSADRIMTTLADQPQSQWAETLKSNGYGSVSERDIQDLYANQSFQTKLADTRRRNLFHDQFVSGSKGS